jgi:murein DD-endopeptidase MepM/ murein hydrolase activator NlpD
MMEKRPSKRFRLYRLLLPFLILSACGSTPKPEGAAPGRQGSAEESATPPAPQVTRHDIRAELSAASAHNGSVLLVTVTVPESMRGLPVSALYDFKEYPFYAVGKPESGQYQTILGVPFLAEPGKATVEVRVGEGGRQKTLQIPFAVTEGPYRSEALRVNPRTVNPHPRDLKRIKKESSEIGALYKIIRQERLWDAPFELPVKSAITSPFGTKRVYNGEMQNFHQGADLKAPKGTPIRAPAGGIVVLAKNLFFTGFTVILDHGYGIYTSYGHMSRLKIRKGARVKAGTLLGLAGATGRASGPHLHWGAVIHQDKVNPIDLMRVLR